MPTAPDSRDLYLSLMERCLSGVVYHDPARFGGVQRPYQAQARELGRDWPERAHTMIGMKRLHNLRLLTEKALHDGIPGDLIETGVWRGGACILMRAVLKAYGVEDRRVFVADSFAGLPAPDTERYRADTGANWHEFAELAVPLEAVRDNFAAYGLLDEQAVFLKGWFKDTLPDADIERLAILRLDGDMYGSTMDAITVLYPKVSSGGYVIVDDYGVVPACRQAIQDYCAEQGIRPEIMDIDGSGVYWRKD